MAAENSRLIAEQVIDQCEGCGCDECQGNVQRIIAAALATRDAEIARVQDDLDRIKEAIRIKGGTEHAPTEWAYLKSCEVIDAHKARVVDLEKALEPFAAAADETDEDDKNIHHIWEHHTAMDITIGDLRAARRALTK